MRNAQLMNVPKWGGGGVGVQYFTQSVNLLAFKAKIRKKVNHWYKL